METVQKIKDAKTKGTVWFGLVSLVLTFLVQYKETFPPKYYPSVIGIIWVLAILKRIFWPGESPPNPDVIPDGPADVILPTASSEIPPGITNL
jgi:hypothetical protein